MTVLKVFEIFLAYPSFDIPLLLCLQTKHFKSRNMKRFEKGTVFVFPRIYDTIIKIKCYKKSGDECFSIYVKYVRTSLS